MLKVGTCLTALLPQWQGSWHRASSAHLAITFNVLCSNRSRRCRTLWCGLKACLIKSPQTSRTMVAVPSRWNPPTCHRRRAARRVQSPPCAFVSLKEGNPGVINARSVTWDCFLADVTERNMKWASDGHGGYFMPLWPIHCFQAFMPLFFPSIFLFLPAPFLVHKSFFWCISSQVLQPSMQLLQRGGGSVKQRGGTGDWAQNRRNRKWKWFPASVLSCVFNKRSCRVKTAKNGRWQAAPSPTVLFLRLFGYNIKNACFLSEDYYYFSGCRSL